MLHFLTISSACAVRDGRPATAFWAAHARCQIMKPSAFLLPFSFLIVVTTLCPLVVFVHLLSLSTCYLVTFYRISNNAVFVYILVVITHMCPSCEPFLIKCCVKIALTRHREYLRKERISKGTFSRKGKNSFNFLIF